MRSKALAFQQPWATLIMLGAKTVECRTRNIKTPVKDLVVCASKTASAFEAIPGLLYGYALAIVDVVECVPFKREHLDGSCMSGMPAYGSNAWILENPRPIKPFRVKASASFFYVENPIEQVDVSSVEDYMRVYGKLGFAGRGKGDVPSEDFIVKLFECGIDDVVDAMEVSNAR